MVNLYSSIYNVIDYHQLNKKNKRVLNLSLINNGSKKSKQKLKGGSIYNIIDSISVKLPKVKKLNKTKPKIISSTDKKINKSNSKFTSFTDKKINKSNSKFTSIKDKKINKSNSKITSSKDKKVNKSKQKFISENNRYIKPKYQYRSTDYINKYFPIR